MSGIHAGAIVLGLAACGVASNENVTPHSLTVRIPENVTEGTRLILVFENATVPGNQPLKLVASVRRDDRETRLGAVGIEGLSPESTIDHRLSAVKLDVTRHINELRRASADGKTVEIRVSAVDGRGATLREIRWSIEAARLDVVRGPELPSP